MLQLEYVGQEEAKQEEKPADKEKECPDPHVDAEKRLRLAIVLISLGVATGIASLTLIPDKHPVKNFALAVSGVLAGRGIIAIFI